MRHAVLAAVLIVATNSTALAWSETTITLADPSGQSTDGTLQTGEMEGYFCSNRPDAETLADYLSGVKVQGEDLAMALGHCKPGVRLVTGLFPEKGKYPVVFVRMLGNLVESSYLVRGFLTDIQRQEAQAHEK